MIKQVKIISKKVVCKKDGKQYIDKRDKKFCRVLIKTDANDIEYSNLAYSKEDIDLVKEGETYELKLEKRGDYYNWKFPDRLDRLEQRIEALEGEEADNFGEEEVKNAIPDISEDTPF